MKEHWRGPINGILYGLIFEQEITDELVSGCAEAAVNYTVLGDGPEAYYAAIGEALSSGERIDGAQTLSQFDQATISDFLRAVATRLDEMRPWPEPKFRLIDDPEAWAGFDHAKPIARVDASVLQVSNIVRGVFDSADVTHPGHRVLMLKLATGETVALLASRIRGKMITLLTDSTGDPAKTIEHFTTATGLPADKVDRL